MKKVTAGIFLIIATIVLAQTSVDIQTEFTQTFNNYSTMAQSFVQKLADLMDVRVNQYIAAHQKLIDNFRSVSKIANVTLDEESERILNGLVGRIETLIATYRTVLDKNIFNNELNRYMTQLQTKYLSQAQVLINELVNYVNLYPAIRGCWDENRDELSAIVASGFSRAREVALSAAQRANNTLNLNEFLVNGVITGNDAFVALCRLNPSTANGCIKTFLNIAQITLPAGSGFWGLTTNMTVNLSLGLTESQIVSTIQGAVLDITRSVRDIETCVRSAILQG